MLQISGWDVTSDTIEHVGKKAEPNGMPSTLLWHHQHSIKGKETKIGPITKYHTTKAAQKKFEIQLA
jgi:hypothetical protein